MGAKWEAVKSKHSIHFTTFQEINMPIIAWLLGVPVTVILLLMLFGVF